MLHPVTDVYLVRPRTKCLVYSSVLVTWYFKVSSFTIDDLPAYSKVGVWDYRVAKRSVQKAILCKFRWIILFEWYMPTVGLQGFINCQIWTWKETIGIVSVDFLKKNLMQANLTVFHLSSWVAFSLNWRKRQIKLNRLGQIVAAKISLADLWHHIVWLLKRFCFKHPRRFKTPMNDFNLVISM